MRNEKMTETGNPVTYLSKECNYSKVAFSLNFIFFTNYTPRTQKLIFKIKTRQTRRRDNHVDENLPYQYRSVNSPTNNEVHYNWFRKASNNPLIDFPFLLILFNNLSDVCRILTKGIKILIERRGYLLDKNVFLLKKCRSLIKGSKNLSDTGIFPLKISVVQLNAREFLLEKRENLLKKSIFLLEKCNNLLEKREFLLKKSELKIIKCGFYRI